MSYVLQQKHHTYINYDVNRLGNVWVLNSERKYEYLKTVADLMTGMTCFYVFFEGLFMRKIVVTKLTNVPVEMKVIIHIRSFKPKFQESTPPKKCLPI